MFSIIFSNSLTVYLNPSHCFIVLFLICLRRLKGVMSRFMANTLALVLSCFCLSAFMYVMKHRMDPLIEVTEKEVDLAQKVSISVSILYFFSISGIDKVRVRECVCVCMCVCVDVCACVFVCGCSRVRFVSRIQLLWHCTTGLKIHWYVSVHGVHVLSHFRQLFT